MERLLPLAEQLDRAAVELRLDHPLHNRLALILIDNAVEIMIRHALWVVARFGGDDLDGMPAKQRKMARSQKLDDRIAVLVFAKALTELEGQFILAAHRERNAAFHEGYISGGHIRPLAFRYYEFACAYLARFEVAFYGYSTDFQFNDITRRYYDTARGSEDPMLTQIHRQKLAELVLEQLPPPPAESLQSALAGDLEKDRKAIVGSFQFMLEHTWPRPDWRELLAQLQFVHARDMALEKAGLNDTLFGTARREEAMKFVKQNLEKFRPRYRAIPHGSWSQAIERIREDPDYQSATVRHRRLVERMAPLRNAICTAALRRELELQDK